KTLTVARCQQGGEWRPIRGVRGSRTGFSQNFDPPSPWTRQRGSLLLRRRHSERYIRIRRPAGFGGTLLFAGSPRRAAAAPGRDWLSFHRLLRRVPARLVYFLGRPPYVRCGRVGPGSRGAPE